MPRKSAQVKRAQARAQLSERKKCENKLAEEEENPEEWRKKHIRVDTAEAPDREFDVIPPCFPHELDGYREATPGLWVKDLSKNQKNIKFMVVIYSGETDSHKVCSDFHCRKPPVARAVVLADVKENQERIERGAGYEEWMLPDHVLRILRMPSASLTCQRVCPDALRVEPTLYRSEVLPVCAYHRHNEHVRGIFSHFSRKNLKRVINK